MAGVYEKYAAMSSKWLTGKFSGAFVLRRVSGGGYDDQGDVVPVTTVDLPVRGIVKDEEIWNGGALLAVRSVARLDIRHQPFPDDQLIVGEDTYTIDTVKTVAPNGVTVIRYEAVLK